MDRRKSKDRRRFKRLNDRRQEMKESVANFSWFMWVVTVSVIVTMSGYIYILGRF